MNAQHLLEPLTLSCLDSFEGDSMVLFLCANNEPLHGVAGLLDWRLSGAITRVRLAHFQGSLGETLMLPTVGRMGGKRLFLMGLGDAQALTLASMLDVLRQAYQVMRRAQCSRYVLAAPVMLLYPDVESLFIAAVQKEWLMHVHSILVLDTPHAAA